MNKLLIATAAGALTLASAAHAADVKRVAFAGPEIHIGAELATWMSGLTSFSGAWQPGDCLQQTVVTGVIASTGSLCAGGTGGNVSAIYSGNGVTVSPDPIVATGTASLTAVTQNTILANITSGSAIPIPNTLTSIIDADIGSTEGGVLGRGSSWSEITGQSGYVLASQSTSGPPQFVNPATLSGIAQSTVVLLSQIGAGTGSVAVPSGAKAILVRVIGAGGPGGGGAWMAAAASGSGGSGGAGAGCKEHEFLASDLPTTIYWQSATGGIGGAAAASSSNAGSNGNGNAQAGQSWIGSSATTNTSGPWYLLAGQGGPGQGGQVNGITTGGGSGIGGSNPSAFTNFSGGAGSGGGFGAQPGGVPGGVGGTSSESGTPNPADCSGGGGGGSGNSGAPGAGGTGLWGPGGGGGGGAVSTGNIGVSGGNGAASYAGGQGGNGGTTTTNVGSPGSAGSVGLEAVSPGGAGGGGGASGSTGSGAAGAGGNGAVCGGGGGGGGAGQGSNAPGAGGAGGAGCVLIEAKF